MYLEMYFNTLRTYEFTENECLKYGKDILNIAKDLAFKDAKQFWENEQQRCSVYFEEFREAIDSYNKNPKYNFRSQSDSLIALYYGHDDDYMAHYYHYKQMRKEIESFEHSRETDLDISAYKTVIIDSNRPQGSVYVTVVCGCDDGPSYLEDICASLNGYLPSDDPFTAMMMRLDRDSRPDGFETNCDDEDGQRLLASVAMMNLANKEWLKK